MVQVEREHFRMHGKYLHIFEFCFKRFGVLQEVKHEVWNQDTPICSFMLWEVIEVLFYLSQ